MKRTSPQLAALPCMHCGGKRPIVEGLDGLIGGGFGDYYVKCTRSRCLAHGPLRSTERGAIKAWNKAPRVPA